MSTSKPPKVPTTTQVRRVLEAVDRNCPGGVFRQHAAPARAAIDQCRARGYCDGVRGRGPDLLYLVEDGDLLAKTNAQTRAYRLGWRVGTYMREASGMRRQLTIPGTQHDDSTFRE